MCNLILLGLPVAVPWSRCGFSIKDSGQGRRACNPSLVTPGEETSLHEKTCTSHLAAHIV